MGKWGNAIFDDVLTIINGKNQKQVENPSGKYPIYGSGGVMGYADEYLCEADTVVIGRKGTINRPIFVEEPFWNVDTAFGLHAKKELYPKYLFYFCEQFDFEALNTTVTIPSLTKSNLLKIVIPLPPLEIQRQIAGVLDRASALIEKRKAQIEKLDLLVKSQFIEMFGDFIITHNQWPFFLLGEHAEVVSGVTKGRKLTDGVVEVPYLRVANVKDGYLDLSEIKTIPATKTEREKYQLKQYDILMTEGGDPDKLGRGAIWSEEIYPCIHQNHIFRVRLEQSIINPVYFTWYLRQPYAKQYFLKSAKQTTGIASINMTQLTRLPVFIPPFSLQTQFADFVQQIEAQKSLLHQSLVKLELNYKSLMQKCFKGEVF